jgi:Fe2+ or Zn2+ uptake regulation protein
VCGNVTDFEDEEAVDALVRQVERRTDFKIDAHRLELVGRCPNCRG